MCDTIKWYYHTSGISNVVINYYNTVSTRYFTYHLVLWLEAEATHRRKNYPPPHLFAVSFSPNLLTDCARLLVISYICRMYILH